MTTKELCDQLEELVDRSSIYEVVQALEYVCFEKAEHTRVNWQDENMAEVWEADAKILQNAMNAMTQ